MTLQTGERVLGRYIVDGILGRGGMGEVYKGHHDRLGLPVALKILTDRSSELEKRFEREARLMARVRHPNIVAIMDFGTTDGGFPCIAMEFIEGEDLSHQLKRRQAMPWPRANQIFAGIVAGLGAMHAAEVLHRDLKPGNIVVAPGPPEVVRIIDFGIARPTGGGHETQLTNTGMVVGTPAYMSPEQMLGVPLDARSDLYSAGLIWFELLTGRGPSAGKSVADMLRRLQEPPPIAAAPAGLPVLPPALVELARELLLPDTNLRPEHAAAVLQRLEQISVTSARTPSGHFTSQVDEPATMGRAMPGIFGQQDSADDDPSDPFRSVVESAHQTRGPAGGPAPAGHAMHGLPTAVLPRAQPPVPDQTILSRPAPSQQPSGAQAVADPSAVEVRYLIAARLPPSRLAQQEERRWLLATLGTHGRSFILGAQFWFAMQLQPAPTAEAGKLARDVLERLKARYGTHALTRVRLVGESFALTPAQLTGAAPLPETLAAMLQDLSGASA